MRRLKTRSEIAISIAAVCLAAPAIAQDAAPVEIAASELPAVVVEGATLEAKPISKRSASQQPGPQAKPKPKPKPSATQAPGSADAPTADLEFDTPAVDATNGEGVSSIAGAPKETIGSAVTVVTGEQLAQRQIRHAADALRSLPGVSVGGQGGPQNLTVVRIRGAESNHTLVRIDGVEVNSGTDGFYDFSNLLVDDIAQIEVIRGPQSGLYSSGALGGVINIVTKRGKGPLTFRARAEGGSFDTKGGMIGLSGGTDRMHGAVSLSGIDTNGFNIAPNGDEDDGGKFSTFSFTGGVLVFDNLKLDATLRKSRRDGDRDGTNDVDPATGLFIASDEPSTFSSDVWLGHVSATLDTFNDGVWINKIHARATETDNRDFSVGLFDPPGGAPSRNISTLTEYGYLSTYRLDAPNGAPVTHFFTGLVEHRREWFEQPLITSEAFERDRDSVAGEIRGEYFDALTLTGNVRHDWNDGFEDETTYRIAASLRPWSSPFRLHASAGTGVKYPSFSEQFGVFSGFVANPNLVAEKSFGWDAGVETTFFGGNAIVDVTYFDTTLENEIDFDFVPPASACGSTPFCFISFNRIGESERRGVEVEARAVVWEGLTVGLAYTYLHAREDNGLEEVRRAPHSGRADINYAFLNGKANLNLAAVYNGEMQDLGFSALTFASERVALDEYWLVTIGASYEVAPGVQIYGRVENALDEDYQEVFGFETAGVAAYAGVKITYEEPLTASWSTYK